MIVGDFAPFGCLVTLSAVRPQLSLVIILRRVAGVTILGSAFIDAIYMTGFASDSRMRPGQREGGAAVIVGNLTPFGRLMALSAVRPKLSLVIVLRRVTGVTIPGCTLEHSIPMASQARNGLVGVSQREGLVVIKSDLYPLGWLMTCLAAPAVLTVVLILRGMTGIAILGRAFIGAIHMTGFASDSRMRPGQREGRAAVIVEHLQPFGRLMALSAVRPELSLVIILRCMAGITIPGCALEHSILMARKTSDRGMRAAQGECGLAMIVEHIQPLGRLMALSAIRPVFSLVIINLRMAGVTILGCALINAVHMTGTASDGLVRIGQHERGL